MDRPKMKKQRRLRAGDVVEVLDREDILNTLDSRGMVEGLPFMPEMFQYCGTRQRVFKSAHKTCDPSTGLKGRRMTNTVHLQNCRCDGQDHGGCQAACLLFWKEDWLRKLENDRCAKMGPRSRERTAPDSNEGTAGCTEAVVEACTLTAEGQIDSEDPIYSCQSTQLRYAAGFWRWWDPRQYLEDVLSRNVKPVEILSVLLLFIYSHIAEAGIGLGSGMRWTYDLFQGFRGGVPYPWRRGKITAGTPTPSKKLGLQPGEVIRVKRFSDILLTLDETMNNRGMYFDPEMVPFTGKSFRVLLRVERIINERTGRMLTFSNDAIILENVTCLGRYSKCRKFCSRGIFPFWREVWLERISPLDFHD